MEEIRTFRKQVGNELFIVGWVEGLDGTHESIQREVESNLSQASGKCIISAGCEITPGTSVENMKIFRLTSVNNLTGKSL